MTRPYGVKGRKRKQQAEPKCDREDEDERAHPKRPATLHTEEQQQKEEAPPEPSREPPAQAGELPGIPIAPAELKGDKPSVLFILERASLEVAKVGKTYQLLNSDDHANFLRKNNKNPGDYRPDITHQALLSILDSPLNKAGRLQAVYIKTEKGVLIEVKPYVRIPRTFKRFSGVMLELLQKLSISAAGKREKLLRTIKNPVTQYLPVNSRKIGLSYSSEKLVNMNDYVSTFPSNMDLVFVVGAMAHGKIETDYTDDYIASTFILEYTFKIETDYTDDYIAISGYPLSAAYCITRICGVIHSRESGRYCDLVTFKPEIQFTHLSGMSCLCNIREYGLA